MLLTRLEIRNFRSLEHVVLDGIGQFNVLIGRNNSGKSAILGALRALHDAIHGVSHDWERVLTDGSTTHPLAVQLRFRLDPEEREPIIALINSAAMPDGRKERLLTGPFYREIEFCFESPAGVPNVLHLKLLSIIAEDGKLVPIQRLEGDPRPETMSFQAIALQAFQSTPQLTSGMLRKHFSSGSQVIESFDTNAAFALHRNQLPEFFYLPRKLMRDYLASTFFFGAHREYAGTLPVTQSNVLSPTGANLSQVLHTLRNNSTDAFSRIERFTAAALPDVGALRTPVEGANTLIAFDAEGAPRQVRLNEMGTGVAQLLMVATALNTTPNTHPICIEEPETHLHPGAQRFLIDQLHQDGRQTLITTHSPLFVNQQQEPTIFRVEYRNRRSTVTRVNDAASLGALLSDVGVRNSDVLLSDSVLFTEGPGDAEVFGVWSEILGAGLVSHGVTVLPMGGGEYADRNAPLRSEVLAQISQQSPVPHIFVIDRDERSPDAVTRLEERLPGRVHVLSRRELENYLLDPTAVLAALRDRCSSDAEQLARINDMGCEGLQALIQSNADDLYPTVLLKRIRWELGGLPGGLLGREDISSLLPFCCKSNLASKVLGVIRSRIKQHADRDVVHAVVKAQQDGLAMEWKDRSRRLEIAPGEEILTQAFAHFGFRYNKKSDGLRIARHMSPPCIAAEIRELVHKATRLAPHGSP